MKVKRSPTPVLTFLTSHLNCHAFVIGNVSWKWKINETGIGNGRFPASVPLACRIQLFHQTLIWVLP